METETNFNLIGKDLERLKKKLAPSKSGLEPNAQGVFEVDPTVSFIIQDAGDRYPNWKLTTYVVDAETYKTAMANEMNARRIEQNPEHFTKDGKLKFVNIYDILDAGDYITIGQDGYLTTIWLMWANRQQIKKGDYKATKISKLVSDRGVAEQGELDGGTYIDVVSIPKSAWATLCGYFTEMVSEDGTNRIERLLDNGVESADFNRWIADVDKHLCNDMTKEQANALREKRAALLEAYKPIAEEIEEDLTGLYVQDLPAIMSREQLSEIDYQAEITFLYHILEKKEIIDELYENGSELMMVTYLDCPSYSEYAEYYKQTKAEE